MKKQIGDCTLYFGDCLEVLPTINVMRATTAVLTDPPYGLSIAKNGTIGGDKVAPVRDYGENEWDSEPCSPRQIEMIRSFGKWQIIFGGNYFHLPPSQCWLVWDKQNTGNFADCELAWTNLEKPVRKISWLWNGMIRKGREERFHPTQKPLGVVEWCLSHLPTEVSLVCDPFMGSGTTGVACVRSGQRFIGVERELKYFDIACRRIEQAYQQGYFFRKEPEKTEQLTMEITR